MSNSARILGLAAFVVGSTLTGEALAHAHLVSATPAENASTAVSPTELDLKFSEGLNLKFAGVTVIGPDKEKLATAAATLREGDDTTLIVPLSTIPVAGQYAVEWHVLSIDGHKSHGSYTFTIEPR